MVKPEEVLTFWFGALDSDGIASDKAKQAMWWRGGDALDEEIRTRFGDLFAQAMSGGCDDWPQTPEGRLAAILLYDQFCRNMHRGTPTMYAADEKAMALVHEGLGLGLDRHYQGHARLFFIMPLMHSEILSDQTRCVALLEQLVVDVPERVREGFAKNIGFARQHLDIVARFGRFPHRNAILGRETTPEEAVFLTQPGSSF